MLRKYKLASPYISRLEELILAVNLLHDVTRRGHVNAVTIHLLIQDLI
jgi:hypothetical protein